MRRKGKLYFYKHGEIATQALLHKLIPYKRALKVMNDTIIPEFRIDIFQASSILATLYDMDKEETINDLSKLRTEQARKEAMIKIRKKMKSKKLKEVM